MSFQLSKEQVGKITRVDNGTVVILPKDVFASGDVLVMFNNSDKFVTIHSSVPNTYVSGRRQKRSAVEFVPRAIASIMFVDNDIAVISGEVS